MTPFERLAAIGAGGIALLLASLSPSRAPLLVWNASASVTPGLYRVWPGQRPKIGDIAIARLPMGTRGLAAARGYLPATVPLVKPVVAIEGDVVCASNDGLFINGRWVADRHARDRTGRAMPLWFGCTRLADGAVLLLADPSDSFDGRYFGITDADDVIGRARLIWAR